jgi:hypothetical protein
MLTPHDSHLFPPNGFLNLLNGLLTRRLCGVTGGMETAPAVIEHKKSVINFIVKSLVQEGEIITVCTKVWNNEE